MESYEELEGKEINFKDIVNRNVKLVVVGGFDYDIGITIINPLLKETDPGYYVVCIPGPSAKHYRKSTYQEDFNEAVKMIERGYFDTTKGRKRERECMLMTPTRMNSCPFK